MINHPNGERIKNMNEEINTDQKSTLNQMLFQAVYYGDPTKVSAALNKGANVNALDDTGNTPAHIAIQTHHFDAFKTLLHYRADLNQANSKGETPLYLLEKKINQLSPQHPFYQNYKNLLSQAQSLAQQNDKSPIIPLWDENTQFYLGEELIKAVKNNDLLAVQDLLKKGANPLHQNSEKETPLLLANFYHFDEISSVITDAINLSQSLIGAIYAYDTKKALRYIEKGAHVMSYDPFGNLGIILAAERELFHLVKKMLNRGVDVNVQNNNGDTLMKHAIRLGDSNLVDFLLDKGFDYARHQNNYILDFDMAIKYQNPYIVQKLINTTPMAEKFIPTAIAHGSNEILNYFLSLNAKIQHVDSPTNPLLISAIHSHNPAIVATVLKNTKLYNQENIYHEWPLLEAVKTGNTEIVQHLLKYSVQVDKTNHAGWTALMEAAKLSKPQIIKMLIEAGADVNKADNYGFTPFIIASLQNDRETVSHLYHFGANINHKTNDGSSALSLAIENNNQIMPRYLLFLGASCQTKTKDGNDLIFAALKTGDVKLVDDLISYGANINAKTVDPIGETPLLNTIKNQQKEMVQLLLEKGADVNLTSNTHHTPLDVALNQFKYASTNGQNPVAYEILDLIIRFQQPSQPVVIQKAEPIPPLNGQNQNTLEKE